MCLERTIYQKLCDVIMFHDCHACVLIKGEMGKGKKNRLFVCWVMYYS